MFEPGAENLACQELGQQNWAEQDDGTHERKRVPNFTEKGNPSYSSQALGRFFLRNLDATSD
jgi:hypothetical protein